MIPERDPELTDAAIIATWLTARKAATAIGVSKNTFERMVRDGEVKAVTIEGQRYFDPEDCEQLTGREGVANKVLLASLNDSVKQAQAHSRAFFDMVNGPAQSLLAMMQAENATLRTRVAELEGKLEGEHAQRVLTLSSYEKVLSEANEREIARAQAQASMARKEQAMGLLWQIAPVLVNQLLASNKVRAMVTGMGQEEIEGMREHGLITAEQYDAICELRKKIEVSNGSATEQSGSVSVGPPATSRSGEPH